MNSAIRWVITLMIALFSAELAPAKGQIVDGVITPSATLTIKSLIEAEHGEKLVVCPKAVHANIKRLTLCAMGYRAVVGKNRILITHMWPAKTIDEFHKRAGLTPLKPISSNSVTDVTNGGEKENTVAVVESSALVKEVEVLKAENALLALRVGQLTVQLEAVKKSTKEMQILKSRENEQLKEENALLQQRIETLQVEVQKNLAEKEENQRVGAAELAAKNVEIDYVNKKEDGWKILLTIVSLIAMLVLIVLFLNWGVKHGKFIDI